jgi:homoserine O-acetyltransferase/O-succinyltransferase
MTNGPRFGLALLLPVLASAQLPAPAPPSPSASPVHRGEHHEFVLKDFKTEGGVTLPEVRVVYGTFGRLNERKDNAVLLPSHYMADHHGYGWLIGDGRVFDESRDFLIATELFGNGKSSSPSNTPEPFHGPRFPIVTIRDNVRAVHRLRV